MCRPRTCNSSSKFDSWRAEDSRNWFNVVCNFWTSSINVWTCFIQQQHKKRHDPLEIEAFTVWPSRDILNTHTHIRIKGLKLTLTRNELSCPAGTRYAKKKNPPVSLKSRLPSLRSFRERRQVDRPRAEKERETNPAGWKIKKRREKCFIWWCEKGQGKPSHQVIKKQWKHWTWSLFGHVLHLYTTARSFLRLEGRGLLLWRSWWWEVSSAHRGVGGSHAEVKNSRCFSGVFFLFPFWHTTEELRSFVPKTPTASQEKTPPKSFLNRLLF